VALLSALDADVDLAFHGESMDIRFWRTWSVDRRKKYVRHIADLILKATAGGLVTLSIHKISPHMPAIYAAMARVLGAHLSQFIIGLFIATMGFVAHRFKQRNQRWYGMVEVMIGIVSGFSIAFGMVPSHVVLAQWASLIGCSYVIARGLNNVSDAKARVLLAP